MENKLHIISDYTDFYDVESTQGNIIYNRILKNSMQRGSALKYIRNMGIETIDIKPVSRFSYIDDKLVVYTDPKKHNGQGKQICTFEEAITYYPNMPASKYIEDTNGFTVKVLQIGKRRFNITFKKDKDSDPLTEGNIIDIQELSNAYNALFKLPIFSVDYIPFNNIMLATDFNEVEFLDRLNIDKYLSSQEIIKEVTDSLIIYNNMKGQA